MGIPVYYLLFHKKQKSEEESKEEEEKKPEINKFLLAIPGFLDTCSTGLANIGLILLPASIYQMLKGSLIVLTFLMSKFVVRNKHTLDHYVAVPVSTIGVVLVGYSAYLNADENEHTSTASQTLLGITLMVIAMFILSIQFCFDEYFMRRYTCHPLICIGYQGVFGFFINLCLCIIFYFIKCGSYKTREEVPYFVENMCTEDDDNEWRPENIVFALRQLIDNHILTIIVPITIIFMSSFNIFGVSITKYGSATTRSVTDNCRSFLVWLFFLMPFNQEDLIEKFNWVQLIGFICICLGAFMYNGMLKLEERRTRKTKKIDLDEPEKKENEEEDEIENRKLLDSQRLSETNDEA
jgi:drug/metabolite transporter (DMT)-like permease